MVVMSLFYRPFFRGEVLKQDTPLLQVDNSAAETRR
jgi:hypothetical protein